jgi:programmed cell death protein 5
MDIDDKELEEIRRRKLLELQKQLEEEQKRRELEARMEAERQALLRRLLTSRARERLANLRLARPELARAAEDAVIQLVQMGRLTPPVDDDTLVQILIDLDRASRKDFKIRFKRK